MAPCRSTWRRGVSILALLSARRHGSSEDSFCFQAALQIQRGLRSLAACSHQRPGLRFNTQEPVLHLTHNDQETLMKTQGNDYLLVRSESASSVEGLGENDGPCLAR